MVRAASLHIDCPVAVLLIYSIRQLSDLVPSRVRPSLTLSPTVFIQLTPNQLTTTVVRSNCL
jgi:hypothetical protein